MIKKLLLSFLSIISSLILLAQDNTNGVEMADALRHFCRHHHLFDSFG
jgi:hypothetical protein